MKITGPGSGAPPVEPPSGKPEAQQAGKTGKTSFAEKAGEARETQGARVHASITADITAELKAGKLQPGAAVDRVVERVLERQLGVDAPAAIREQVRAALREAIDSDPLLAEKLRGLTG